MTTLTLAWFGGAVQLGMVILLPVHRMYFGRVFNVFWMLLWFTITLSMERYGWACVFGVMMIWSLERVFYTQNLMRSYYAGNHSL